MTEVHIVDCTTLTDSVRREIVVAVDRDMRRAASNPLLAAPYVHGGSVNFDHPTGNWGPVVNLPDLVEARTDHIARIFRGVIADYFRATGWGHVCTQSIGNGDFRVSACGVKGVELAAVKVYSGAKDEWMRVLAAKMREAINAKISPAAPRGLVLPEPGYRRHPGVL